MTFIRSGLATVIILVLLVWAGYSMARIFWLLTVRPTAALTVIPAPAGLPGMAPLPVSVDLLAVQRNIVLTEASRDALATAPGAIAASSADTRLAISLHGTVAGARVTDSYAIIASEGAQSIYRTGDTLTGSFSGVRLLGIYPDRVELDNNGRIETLSMYGNSGTAFSVAAGLPGGLAPMRNDAAPETDTSAAEPSVSFSSHVRVQLFQEEGVIKGLQLRHGSRQDVLSRFGLRVGDIITEINGERVSSPAQLQAFVERMNQQAAFDLRVRRAGDAMTINITQAMWAP